MSLELFLENSSDDLKYFGFSSAHRATIARRAQILESLGKEKDQGILVHEVPHRLDGLLSLTRHKILQAILLRQVDEEELFQCGQRLSPLHTLPVICLLLDH